MAGCNCGGGGTAKRYQLQDGGGAVKGTYLTRTEAVAALSVSPSGYRVVTVG